MRKILSGLKMLFASINFIKTTIVRDQSYRNLVYVSCIIKIHRQVILKNYFFVYFLLIIF